MAEEKAVAVIEQPKETDLAEWRSRDEIVQFGKRVKTMMPGGDKLTDIQAMAIAQYSLAMGVNPLRGEMYGYQGRNGQLVIVDGYKALVRWARGKCEYTDKYELAPGIPEGSIGFRCYILREDKKQTMRDFISMGAKFKEAYDLCAVYADGVVKASEMYSERYKKPIDPPTGWTWEMVARKRALKNTLNLSHGAPSPQEIASGSWNVNGVQTQPQDWEAITPGMNQEERDATAEFGALAREAHEHAGDVSAAQATDELFGEYEGDGEQPVDGTLVEEIEAVLAQELIEPLAPNWVHNQDHTTRFYTWLDGKEKSPGVKIRKGEMYQAIGVTSSLKEYTGTIGDAKQAVDDWIKAREAAADGSEEENDGVPA